MPTRIDVIREALRRGDTVDRYGRALRDLPPGALQGRNADLVAALREEGAPIPERALHQVTADVGTTLMVDAAGGTARFAIEQTGQSTDAPWLDARANGALEVAEVAAATSMDCWAGRRVPAVTLAPGESPPRSSITGESVGLALSLAILSRWTGQPLRADRCASGEVLQDATLRPVLQVEEKARALRSERPFVEALVVPRGSSTAAGVLPVIEVGTLREAAGAFGLDLTAAAAIPEVDPEAMPAAVDETLALAKTRAAAVPQILVRMELLRRSFGRLSPQRRNDVIDVAELKLLGPLCEYLVHAGRAEEVPAVLDDLDRILTANSHLVDEHRADVTRLRNIVGEALLDLGLLAAAREVVNRRFAAARGDERLRLRTTLGRIAAHAGDRMDAERHLRQSVVENIEHGRRSEWNIPRCGLISVLVRMQRYDEAEALLRQGRDLNAEVAVEGWSRDNADFLDLEEAKLALARGAHELVEEIWARYGSKGYFWPRLAFLRRVAESRRRRGVLERAVEAAELAFRIADGSDSPVVAPRVAAATAAPIAADLIERGDRERAAPLLERIRTICARQHPEADAPFAEPARRLAAGDESPAALRAFSEGEIY